jgi:alpha-L-fucosidase
MKKWFLPIFVLAFCKLQAQSDPVLQERPTKQQLAWHEMEFYLFMHFGPNTFTGKEWGEGTEPEDLFNPTQLDCRQWCRVAKAAGAKGIIITAKHHDGFCLWPSKFSKHTVRESKWKDGKGDVLKELSDACKEYGLKFGVYISPWDRNHPDYGTEKYNDVFVNMMKEIFQNYAPIWELWWDGANGEGPNGKKQIYDWRRFENTVRSISPQTVVFSDIGPDIRWCGNENGSAGKTNWNYLDTAGFSRGIGAPPTDALNEGNVFGKNWIPAECDVSIRPGWFWHSNDDAKVKTGEQLFDLYLKSAGRGANLLLNVPPDNRGIVNENDSAALMDFKLIRDKNFENNISRNGMGYYIPHNGRRAAPGINDGDPNNFEIIPIPELMSMGIEFKSPQLINCIVLKENIASGQNCIKFRLLLMNQEHELIKELNGTTIGIKRIISFPRQRISIVGFTVIDQKAATKISEIETYLIDEKLVEK